MKKDNVRDYVVSMFRFYSLMGEPPKNKIEIISGQLSEAEVADLVAVCETVEELESSGYTTAATALKEIYFINPAQPLRRNALSERVVKYSIEHYIAEDVVWKALRKARNLCADKRKLNKRNFI